MCVPTSGTDFPVGATTVNCVATDAAHNVRSRSFVLTVVDNDARTFTVIPGGLLSVNVGGADALAVGTLALHSEPTVLGSYPVDDQGRIAAAATVPLDMPLGAHTLVLQCVDEAGNPIIWQWNVVVQAAEGAVPTTTTLPSTSTSTTLVGVGPTTGTASGEASGLAASPVPVSATSGALPATGGDVAAPAALGVVLVAGGAGCVALSRRRRRKRRRVARVR